MLGICADEPIMLVMELARLGPLNKYLRSHASSVSMATITMYMYQVSDVSFNAYHDTISSYQNLVYCNMITSFSYITYTHTHTHT